MFHSAIRQSERSVLVAHRLYADEHARRPRNRPFLIGRSRVGLGVMKKGERRLIGRAHQLVVRFAQNQKMICARQAQLRARGMIPRTPGACDCPPWGYDTIILSAYDARQHLACHCWRSTIQCTQREGNHCGGILQPEQPTYSEPDNSNR